MHQLRVLRTATDELLSHLRERSQRLSQLSVALSNAEELNDRQQAVLAYLVRNPHQSVTVNGHANSHEVVYLTARRDLQDLERQGLLRRTRKGTTDRYYATEAFVARFMRQE